MDAAPLSRLDLPGFHAQLGDAAVMDEILGAFLEVSDQHLAALNAALRSENPLLWLRELHQLKGAALNLTARRLAGLCEEAETIRRLPHGHAEAILFHLQKECAFLHEEIRKYRLGA